MLHTVTILITIKARLYKFESEKSPIQMLLNNMQHTHAQLLTNDSDGEDHPASAMSLRCSHD